MSNLNFNSVQLAGRLTMTPELKQTPSGTSVLQAALAVNRRYIGENSEQTADFINIVAWRKTAEFIAKYFKKGSNLLVTGSLQSRIWTDNDGKKHYVTEVLVDEAFFIESKQSASESEEVVYTQDDLPFN